MRAVALALLLSASPALAAGTFTLRSADTKEGGTVPERSVYDGFGCTGGNVSPQLTWSGAPAGTKSFVVTVYDPDAPTGSGWWHWVVYDIPASTTELPAGAGSGTGLPDGAKQGRTDYGSTGYGGPCPPPGSKHRYVFTVFALKVDRLDVPEDASPALIGFMTRANALASAKLTATYARRK
ncbi:MAG TPA: kinase inhibitor [Anaeromyxobacter sp.]|nr:kinase inhibitor [Anaeromyxobacter sp.]